MANTATRTWYAIRTMPGFQAPHREHWPEPSASAIDGRARGKGYHMASAIDPGRSKIEANLDDAGVIHYMPAEYMAVRNRSKASIYELRRFAMLKGYMFVELADEDWYRLFKVAGVHGVVDNCGKPFAIGALDLFRLRMYEQNSKAVAVAKAASLSTSTKRLEREKHKHIIRGARKKLFPGREVKLIWGDKVGREATVQAWDDQDQVRVMLDSLESATETITVPFEFLKVAS
jgi:transcription antitermination factor NusG